jgi:hypothetical protein
MRLFAICGEARPAGETFKQFLTLPSYRCPMLRGAIDNNHGDQNDRRPTLHATSLPSRRLTSRIHSPGDVWVYWHCHGREDVSLVRNLSMGGLFIETPTTKGEGVRVRLHFLVQEGQIRADAVVRFAKAATGLGLKFTALSEQDRPKLAALLSRLRRQQHAPGKL